VTGKRSRTKGHSFERQMANMFTSIGFPDARRGIQYRDGAECPDVMNIEDVWVECKVGARPNIKGAMEQATKACGSMKPIAITKWDRGPTYVTMNLEFFKVLISLYGGENEADRTRGEDSQRE